MNRNDAVITSQTKRLKEILGKLLPANTKYALIDFPDHSNVGDSAIWLGEIKLLVELTSELPSYVSTVESFDAEKLVAALPDGPILIHGGGNFGDIWRKHQDFRELILTKFKDRVVIQLPQSIKFSDDAAIAQCAKAISNHGRFHLLVRDSNSLALARERFSCVVDLVPDAAFALGALIRPIPPQHDVFLLLRTDSEQADYDRAPFDTIEAASGDWLEEDASFNQTSKRRAAFKALWSGAWSAEQRRLVYYQQLATGRLDRGLLMLASGRKVITDRLHAHILSTLLDIPHVALDNSYGKISGYIAAWTQDYPALEIAKSAPEALKNMKRLPN
jgi:exopolysaccharide biosynthesis predicted pyruvyltransferase EpsI